ncbi:Ppx/GppA phosphatase family protein [Streptomyces polygonati]|uniref:Ppx/GppA phosphatase family protein n=1 Tax=Streptomyces polygonati TaxID=1617087 RepID=A0ABV8HTT6_9ACTN
MRCGVLDIGSQSAQLRIVDLVPGLPPQEVATVKQPVRLGEGTDRGGTVGPEAVRRLVHAVTEAVAAAKAHGVDTLYPFVTSVVRDAANRDEVLRAVSTACGVQLATMTGEEEARLTFVAARSWYGWSAGPMLLADIGGGSLEIAYGRGGEPSFAVSLPLGAGRLTRQHLPRVQPPYGKGDIRSLQRHIRAALAGPAAIVAAEPAPELRVATSRTFTQLARLTGAPAAKAGPYAVRTLDRAALTKWIPRLARMTAAERTLLPGVSQARAHQILAGAVVAETVMDLLHVQRFTVCPWALRDGILLEHLGALPRTAPQSPRSRPLSPPPAAVARRPRRVVRS